MAYEMQGISALDPRVAATEKFINENNIPPDQVPDFLLSMGADPKLAGLVFKYRRLQNAAGQQQNQPPASTVAQDVDQQYAQMQGGVASLPAPVMENAQFQGGIAPPQEEAPPQGMAGGGIVAFSNGGLTNEEKQELAALRKLGLEVESTRYYPAMGAVGVAPILDRGSGITSALYDQRRKRLEELVRKEQEGIRAAQEAERQSALAEEAKRFGLPEVAAEPATAETAAPEEAPPVAAPPFTPREQPAPPRAQGISSAEIDRMFKDALGEKPDLGKITTAREEEQRRLGTGQFSKATKEEEAFIKEQKEKLGKRPDEARKDFWMMLGASLLGNKSPNFQVALGESLKENYGNLIKDLREISNEEKDLQKLSLQLRRAQELAIESDRKEDVDRFDALKTRYDSMQLTVLNAKLAAQEKILDRELDIKLAQLREQGDTELTQQLLAEYEAAKDPKLPPEQRKALMDAFNEKLAMLGKITEFTTGSAIAARLKAESSPYGNMLGGALSNSAIEEELARRGG